MTDAVKIDSSWIAFNLAFNNLTEQDQRWKGDEPVFLLHCIFLVLFHILFDVLFHVVFHIDIAIVDATRNAGRASIYININ